MDRVIIGSTAMHYWGINTRTPRDLDTMSTDYVEGEDTTILPKTILDAIPRCGEYATIDALYTIKCSHLGWDIKWEKHKRDALYLRSIGAEIIHDLYHLLVDFWRVEHGNKDYLSLYQKKSDFFNDHVTYVYDHDYLHELVAYPNKPTYTLCLVEGESVAIDRDKFLNLSLDVQRRLFMEEITVISVERWLVNPGCIGKYSIGRAHSLSVHKTITSLTKNWATDFLIENLEFFIRPDLTYYNHILTTLKEGEDIMATVADLKGITKEIMDAYNLTNPKWEIEELSDVVDLVDFGDFVNITTDGGGEGGAEHCYTVFKWKDVLYSLSYSYYSHVGFDFDYASLHVVEEKTKTITVYT